MYYFAKGDHVTHSTDVSVNKLPPPSSPKIKSGNKQCSKAGCWRGDEEKSQSPLTPQPAGTGRCSKSKHPPTQRDTVVEVPFPVPKSPFREAQGEAHNFWTLEWLPMSCCCMWGAFQTQVGCMPGQGISHAAPEEFMQWPASSRHDWSHSHGLHEPVCAICHISVFPSGAAAWLEQGRGLILLSLQEFNWKGIVFDLISSLVSTQA